MGEWSEWRKRENKGTDSLADYPIDLTALSRRLVGFKTNVRLDKKGDTRRDKQRETLRERDTKKLDGATADGTIRAGIFPAATQNWEKERAKI